MTFTTLSFDRRINACLKACGYVEPTPIQRQAIPPVLQGHDVMGLAQTGTGKTAAFALPILQRLLTSESSAKAPRVLVLAPTRELALQINESFTNLARRTGIRSAVVIGGVGMGPQIRACASSQIIVACPGRLVRLMAKNSVNLGSIDTLVLDEADRMLDMGFMPDIKKIIAKLPSKRQNLLFSATMPNSILAFAKRILVNPKIIRIKATSPVTSVKHVFYKTYNNSKSLVLEEILSRAEHQSVLVFTRTKHKAKNLARKLSNSGHDATFLQGNMSQNQREKALNGFRDGRFSIMVATDIAARGIDCDRITHVVNYDMPDTVETYTHRIGRTGRAGRSGNAISLVTRDDAPQLRALERIMKITVDQHSAGGRDDGGDIYGGPRKTPPQPSSQRQPRNRRRRSGRAQRATA